MHVPVRVRTLERELFQEQLEHDPARVVCNARRVASVRGDEALEEALAGVRVHHPQFSLRGRALGVVAQLVHHALKGGVHVGVQVDNRVTAVVVETAKAVSVGRAACANDNAWTSTDGVRGRVTADARHDSVQSKEPHERQRTYSNWLGNALALGLLNALFAGAESAKYTPIEFGSSMLDDGVFVCHVRHTT